MRRLLEDGAIVESDALIGEWVKEAMYEKHGDIELKHSYFWGYVLGDGWISKRDSMIGIKIPEFDDMGKIVEEVYSIKEVRISKGLSKNGIDLESDIPVYRYSIYSERLKEEALSYGLKPCGASNKVISDLFMNLDEESTKWLLRGLFDSDGTSSMIYSITSSSNQLLQSIRVLLLRFGIRSSIVVHGKEGKVLIRGRVCTSSGSWKLYVKGKESVDRFYNEIGFSINRKNNKVYKSRDVVLIPYLKEPVEKFYRDSQDFRRYLKLKGLDSIRKTITNSGDVSKRARELTVSNILDILKYESLPSSLRLKLEDSLKYFYSRVKSLM